MDRYSEYKDSGIEWIGEIPGHWSLGKLKHFCSHINKKRYPNDGDIKISAENVESGTGKVEDFYADFDHLGMEFQIGDTLLNKLRVYLAKVVFCEYSGLSMSEMIVLRPLKFSSKFQFYLLTAEIFIDQLNSLSEGVKMPRVPIVGIMNSYVPAPPINEQIQIARYLDKKISQIDPLIKKLQQKIELLKEYRTALISQCVTKGLDPNVEMKDSGIKWIGEIPRHWSISFLKYSLNLIMGQSPKAGAINDEGKGIPFLQGCKEFGKRYPAPAQFISSPLKTCNKDSILLSVRAPVGRLNYSDQNYGIGRGLCALSAIDNISHIKFALFQMEILIYELERVSSGSTYTAVTVSDIKSLFYIVVPIDEQIQISQYLDQKTSQIDSLIENLQQKIELLKEYRQSLISNAVTGKVRVSELAK